MDSETIREAVETWRRSMSGFGDPEEAGRADAVLHRAALRYADLLEAQERGEAAAVVKVECGECGGDGMVPIDNYEHREIEECPSCGGTGRVWPEWAIAAVQGIVHYRREGMERLDALAAAAREWRAGQNSGETMGAER